MDYGAGGGLGSNLQRVAALIAAKIPTRLFYVTYQGNSFDTTSSRRISTAGC